MIATYEQRLNSDLSWALDEGSRHFEECNAVHRALRRITARLTELGVPHAVGGGMAMFFHGFRQFTEQVEILVARRDFPEIRRQLDGNGYFLSSEGSQYLRDAEVGVKIDFLVTGDYPGDGKPKSIAFPDPSQAVVVLKGIPCIELPTLFELKLASGMSLPHPYRDFGDVQQIVQVLEVPREFATQLNPFVRAKFEELWDGVEQSRRLE